MGHKKILTINFIFGIFNHLSLVIFHLMYLKIIKLS